MPRQQSFTSTDSFREQYLRAERWRLALMIACFALSLAAIIVRRILGDVVASVNIDFFAGVAVLVVGIGALSYGLYDASRRLARGLPMPPWRTYLSVLIDLGVPYAILLILHIASPRGAYAALSAPVLLIVPIVIMLSVLRLRPLFSFITGLIAALAHWALVYDTFRHAEVPPHHLPMLASYGVLLLFTGFAAAMLSWFVRRYIEGAMREAQAAERAARELAQVEHDLDIARDIQRGLLPPDAPHHPAFELAAMARPADKAGGDYYDWQPLPDDRLVVAIADVTGHGIGPALVMAVCRAYARATAPTANGPGELLERLNTLIMEDVKGQRFITMAVAVLNPDATVDLVSAGHGPTFLCHAAHRSIEWFGGDALPLGVMEAERFAPVTRLELQPGDTLVLLTDGFVERANKEGELFGVERLSRLIAECAERPPAEMIAAIDRGVESYAEGAPQGDDMTAVVIRCKPAN